MSRYKIEVLTEDGEWKLFNKFEGNLDWIREKAAYVMTISKYYGVKITKNFK